MKHNGAGAKNIPVRLTNTVPTLAPANGGEIKGTMNVGICMGEIDVPTKWKKFVTQGVCFGGIGWADEMGVARGTLPKEFSLVYDTVARSVGLWHYNGSPPGGR